MCGICLRISSYMNVVIIFLSWNILAGSAFVHCKSMSLHSEVRLNHYCVNACQCNQGPRILAEFLLVSIRLMGYLNRHGISSLTKGLDASSCDRLLIKCLNVIVKTLRTRLDS